MPTLYLHAGVHRTATSSTQHFLRDNAGVLLSKGYLYPFKSFRHEVQVKEIANRRGTSADLAAELMRQVNAAPAPVHSVIFSDEDISIVPDLGLFADLKQQFDVKVVMSLRRQDLWLESWYLQNVKWQWNPLLAHLRFDQFLERRAEFFWIDYAKQLARYEAIFGEGSVITSVFEPQAMPAGPIAAVLKMVGITDLTGFGPFLNINSSMSPLVSEFMRHLPLDGIDEQDRAIFERAFVAMDKKLQTNGSKLLMPHEERMQILAEFAASNRETARRYLGRDVLFEEPVPGPDALLADRQLPPNSVRLMKTMVASMVRELGDLMTQARLARERAARQRRG